MNKAAVVFVTVAFASLLLTHLSRENANGTDSVHSHSLSSSTSPSLTDSRVNRALPFLASACNTITGDSCNPSQLPGSPSASTYTPGRTLGALSTLNVTVIPQSQLYESFYGGVMESMSDYSSDASSSFGLNINVGDVFGASAGFKSVHDRMFVSEHYSYFARLDVVYALYDAILSPDFILTASPDLHAALLSLPSSLSPKQNLFEYFYFFQKYSTHYVKKITFGGRMSMSCNIDAEKAAALHMDEASLSLGLMASFSAKIGLGASWGKPNQTAANEFNRVSSEQLLKVQGGNLTTRNNIDKWINSVVDSTSEPVHTTLGFIGDLALDIHQSVLLQTAYEKYLTVCPVDKQGNVCGGVGLCNYNLDPATCTCPANRNGTACQVKDCESKCVNGYCDGDTGVCLCKSGWMGCTCEEQCGTQHYQSPSIKGEKQTYKIDHCDEHGKNCGQPNADCFCDYILPGSSAINYVDGPRGEDTAHMCEYNPNDHTFRTCIYHWYHWCKHFDSVTCAYDQRECVKNDPIICQAPPTAVE